MLAVLVIAALAIGILLLTADMWGPEWLSTPTTEPKPPVYRLRRLIGFAIVAAGVSITFLPVSADLSLYAEGVLVPWFSTGSANDSGRLRRRRRRVGERATRWCCLSAAGPAAHLPQRRRPDQQALGDYHPRRGSRDSSRAARTSSQRQADQTWHGLWASPPSTASTSSCRRRDDRPTVHASVESDASRSAPPPQTDLSARLSWRPSPPNED